MGFTHKEAVERFSKIEGYKPLFKAAFGDEKVDIDRIAQAGVVGRMNNVPPPDRRP